MATWLKRFHLMMMIVWAGLAVPGIIFWRDSILFIIILSIYSYTSYVLLRPDGSAAPYESSAA